MNRLFAKILGPQSVVALDIGSSTLKVLQIEQTGGHPILRSADSWPTPRGAIDNGLVKNRHAVADALRTALDRNDIGGGKALLAVGGPSLVLRWIEMPMMSESDLKEAIRFESRKHLPFSAEQAVIDCRILSRRARQSEDKMRVLLIAVPRTVVDSRFEAAEMAGLDPSGMDIEPLAAVRAVAQSAPKSELSWGTQPEAVLVLGSAGTDFYVTKEGELEFSRRIPIGGNNLAGLIAESTGAGGGRMSEQELLALMSFDDDGALAVSDGHADLLEKLGGEIARLDQEIRRSCSYYQSLFPEGSYEGIVSKLTIGGGLASVPGLGRHLSKELDVPVDVADPLSMLPLTNAGGTLDKLNGKRMSFIVSAGLIAAHVAS